MYLYINARPLSLLRYDNKTEKVVLQKENANQRLRILTDNL